METRTRVVPTFSREARPERAPLPDGLQAARGILNGLALSIIAWLALLVLWLSV